MNGEFWIITGGLAFGTLLIRLAGVFVGRYVPKAGRGARFLRALPGCLTISLVAIPLLNGGTNELFAAIASVAASIYTRSLPITMITGIASIQILRQIG